MASIEGRGVSVGMAGGSGSHKSNRSRPDSTQRNKLSETSAKPVVLEEEAGRKSILDCSRSAPSSGGGRDGQQKVKAGKVPEGTVPFTAVVQVPSAAGDSLAERRALLQGKIQKSGAGMRGESQSQSGNLVSSGLPRDSAAGEREARIRAEKAALLQESEKKRETAALKQQTMAERAARAALQKQQALAERASAQKELSLAERAARQRQQALTERDVPQSKRDTAPASVHRKEKKRRRHADEEESDHGGGHKARRIGIKPAGGVSHDDSKLTRPAPTPLRDDSMPKLGSQRSGKRSSKDGSARGEAGLSDEEGRKPRSLRWEQESSVPSAKSKRVAFAQRVTQLDSSSEDDYAAAVHSRRDTSFLPPSELSAHASAEKGARRKGGGASNGAAALGSGSLHEKRDAKSNGSRGGTTALGRWGDDVDKLMADRRAYLGHGVDTRPTKSHSSRLARATHERSQPVGAAAAAAPPVHMSTDRPARVPAVGATTASARALSVPAKLSDVQRNVAMHDVECQTEDADVRCSAAQTPATWGRSSQCQTDTSGVHEVLRVGAPETVDTGCGPSSGDLQNVPEASERGHSMHEDAAAATRALAVIEHMRTHAPHAQRKQLQDHCRRLGQLMAEVSGVAEPRSHSQHACAPREQTVQHGGSGRYAVLPKQLSPRPLDSEPVGISPGDRGHSPEVDAAMHDTRVNESSQDDRPCFTDVSTGGDDEPPLRPREQVHNRDTEAGMHDSHACGESDEDAPSVEADGLQDSDAVSEGQSEGDMEEDLSLIHISEPTRPY